MTQLLENIFAANLPEDYCHSEIIPVNDIPVLRHTSMSLSRTVFTDDVLVPGSYEILFTTKDCTEEQAATLPMEDSGINFGYKDYEGKQSSHFYADHALLSLLRSRSLDPKNKNYLLLKKIS